MSDIANRCYQMRIVDGNPVVECFAEETEGPDGSRNVVVHAPSLRIVGEFVSRMKEKGELNG